MVLRPLDEIGDDQKVAGKAHLDDDLEFEVETLAIGPRGFLARLRIHIVGIDLVFQPRLKPFARHQTQRFLLVRGALDLERRQDRRPLRRHIGAASGDDDRIVNSFGQVGEKLTHICRRLEVMLLRQAAALSFRHIGAAGDAEQRIVRLVHVGGREIGVIGSDQRDIVIVGEFQQTGFGLAFDRRAVALNLDIEAAGKHVVQALAHCLRRRALPVRDQPAQRPVRPAGEAQQAFGAFGEFFQRGVSIAVLGCQERFGSDFHHVFVAGLVLHQQHQPVVARHLALAIGFTRGFAFARNVDLSADDRLDAALDAASANSSAPNRLLVSVTATAGMSCSLHSSTSFGSLIAPSDSE